jgi:translation initiation factor 4A
MSITNFENFHLNEQLISGIYKFGFEKPSYIQSVGIEPILTGKDCIIQAQSGTGKTGTFVIGVLQQIDLSLHKPQAIIIVPTRELVRQIYNVFRGLTVDMPDCKTIHLMGGTKVSNDIHEYQKMQPQIIVSTPGRLYDLISNQKIETSAVKMLILDEADELLTGNFKTQLYNVFKTLTNHETMQVILVSATIPPEIRELSAKILRDPIEILVKTEDLTLEGIRQFVVYYQNQQSNKFTTLMFILNNITFSQAIIYVNTRRTCEYLADLLEDNGYIPSVIHGELSQKDRNYQMNEFKTGSTRILLTTDLLSRGIDIQQISMVINYEMPNDMDIYLHRSGRSGRFGRKGVCINFVFYKKQFVIKKLEEYFATLIEELPENLEF